MHARDIHQQFEQAFNAGNMEQLLGFYEPSAVIVPQPGSVAAGTSQIREALQVFLGLGGRIRLETVEVLEAGDTALLSCRWTLSGTGPDGNAIALGGTSAEVARRQADGSWRYVIDNPWADQTILAG